MAQCRGLEGWHSVAQDKNIDGLEDLLADDVVFHSPVVHTPQEGKPIATMYLTAAAHVLGNDNFEYVREVQQGNEAILEFSTVLDGITINGVDMIRFNDDGQIIDFKVMVRPLKAIQKIHQMMGEMLQKLA